MRKTDIEVGGTDRFTPACLVAEAGGNMEMSRPLPERRRIEGTIVQVHEEHHWFRVRYRVPGADADFYEVFKFGQPLVGMPYKNGYHFNGSIMMKDAKKPKYF